MKGRTPGHPTSVRAPCLFVKETGQPLQVSVLTCIVDASPTDTLYMIRTSRGNFPLVVQILNEFNGLWAGPGHPPRMALSGGGGTSHRSLTFQ